MTGIVAYALSKKLVNGVASGVKNAVVDDVLKTITFNFVNGSKSVMHFNQPKDGVSIVSVYINDDKHLICTMSDATTMDAGLVPFIDDANEIKYTNAELEGVSNVKQALDYIVNSGLGGSQLDEDLVATNEIGSVTNGKKYDKGTALEKLLRDILIKEEAPTVTLSYLPNTELYDVVEDTLSEIDIKAVVGKKTYDVKKIDYYVNSTLVYTETTDVVNGGTFTYKHTFATPTNKDITLKVTVTDIKDKVTTKTATIKFIGKTYYGYLVEGTTIDEDSIKTLNTTLKVSPKFEYKEITTEGTDLYHIVLCQPKSLGNITTIKDVLNFEYIQDYTKEELTIDGINYVLLYLTNPVSVTDFVQKFN